MDHSVRSSVLLVNIAFICTHRSVLQLKKGNCWKKWQSCLQIQMQERKNWYELLNLVDRSHFWGCAFALGDCTNNLQVVTCNSMHVL